MKLLLENWNKFVLNESSLSRLHKHISEHDTAIITAFRNDPTDASDCSGEASAPSDERDALQINKERNRELKAALLRKGYGVTRVDGSYIEDFGDVDKQKEVSEESFFVVNLKDAADFNSTVAELGKMFCQDSVLIIPQGGSDAYLLGTNNSWPGLGVKEPVGGFTGGKEAEFMSRVRKRPFIFKEVKEQEKYSDLGKNAKWAVAKIAERVWNRQVVENKITATIKAKEEGMPCPAPTQDLELNTKNRDAAIKAEHIQYGPLNVDEPGDYWKDIAEYWNTTEEAAQKSLCGNCVAFDISPRMDECMPGEVSDKDGRLGYCWMHHFKCHSARSCRTWAKGGPITEDKVSYDWQERSQSSMEEEKKKKDDRCTRIAKRKYDVWPSAYASGAVVRCRQGKIWKGVKEDIEKIVREEVEAFLAESGKCQKGYKTHPTQKTKEMYGKTYRNCIKAEERELTEEELEEKKTDYSKEKESGLHGWFSRQGGKGKSKGWVDCNTCRTDKKTGKKTCKSCGRKEGEKRAKYPSCRPTPSACGTKGKGKKWGKKK